MKTYTVYIQLNYDTITKVSPTEKFLKVKKVIHTNGGHLKIIHLDNSEVIFNSSSWYSYNKVESE